MYINQFFSNFFRNIGIKEKGKKEKKRLLDLKHRLLKLN